jgi:hypothetical protein
MVAIRARMTKRAIRITKFTTALTFCLLPAACVTKEGGSELSLSTSEQTLLGDVTFVPGGTIDTSGPGCGRDGSVPTNPECTDEYKSQLTRSMRVGRLIASSAGFETCMEQAIENGLPASAWGDPVRGPYAWTAGDPVPDGNPVEDTIAAAIADAREFRDVAIYCDASLPAGAFACAQPVDSGPGAETMGIATWFINDRIAAYPNAGRRLATNAEFFGDVPAAEWHEGFHQNGWQDALQVSSMTYIVGSCLARLAVESRDCNETCAGDDARPVSRFDGTGCDCIADPREIPVGCSADDATCDGVDDDCDGEDDEDYGVLSCGVGACAVVESACPSGSPIGVCVPGLPTPEIEDDIDNDCDGSVDEFDGVVNAGPDITAECTGNGVANVTLDGSGSSVPIGVPEYQWYSTGGIVLTDDDSVIASGNFPIGIVNTATLVLTYGAGLSDGDSAIVSVVDSFNPTLNIPPDVVAASCTSVVLGEATASDTCSDVDIVNDAPATFRAGVHTVTWRATDLSGRYTEKKQKVTVGLGNSSSCCPVGANVITGTSNNDVLLGTSGVDCIFGLGGQDTLRGGAGNDIVSGGDGDDVVEGGTGNDVLEGGSGQDTLRGSAGNDGLNGGDGDDWCYGGDNDDVVSGGQGQDRLFGDGGNDTLFGDAGDDQLNGGTGDDALDGGANHNQCDGGTGTNTLVSCNN